MQQDRGRKQYGLAKTRAREGNSDSFGVIQFFYFFTISNREPISGSLVTSILTGKASLMNPDE